MKSQNRPLASRRNVIKMMALSAASVAAPFVWTPSRAASRQIAIRDSGGFYARVYKDILYQPFTKATGIEIVSSPGEPDPIAQIQMMVETKRYLWDMATITDPTLAFLTTAGNVYLEQHGLEHDPFVSSIPRQFMSPYGVGSNVSSVVLAYRTDISKWRRAPQSWEDLWDVNHFPGRRSLRKHPFGTLEIALMANGVSPSNIYPCDLDKAFHSLDKLKSQVNVWWTSGPQSQQLLTSKEVYLTPIWISRAYSAIDAGAPYAISLEQHLYHTMSWAILKGTPHADACRQFIKFASDPKRQALIASYGIAPTQPDAFNTIDPKHAKRLSTYPANLKRGVRTDAAYWVKNQKVAIERFNDWLLSPG